MDKFHLQYSDKNIPAPSKNSFLKCLISKTESFINRLRWKAFHYDRRNEEENEDIARECYGFKTEKSPPPNIALTHFENDMHDLISDIKFTKIEDEFQKKLKIDIKKIRNSEKFLVCADKSSNIYKMEVENYRKLVKDNVTKEYRKAPHNAKNEIDKEALTLVTKLKLDDRVQAYTTNDSFITLKDHKSNFYASPQCRLINPAKPEIGKISKKILEKIVLKVNQETGRNLWKNTHAVLDWFKTLRKGPKSRFIQFDIESFYPSISRELLDKALEHAKSVTQISQEDLDIIELARKSLLFSNNECWMKKSNDLFDVTMGAWDGAEVCELVGLYLLGKISQFIPLSQVGLYRDDGLAVISNCNGQKLDRIRKQLHECFKREDLKIVVQINMLEVDFLDVHLNLTTGTFRPYMKPNNSLQYVHACSNHPKSITKNIPKMIEKRLSLLSSTQEIFEEEKRPYEAALRLSGYEPKLSYIPEEERRPQKRQRRRNILWFNPPYSKTVSTNIGKKFLGILGKHFPKNHKYHKIFNKNTVKISYSCMTSMGNIIKGHNATLLRPSQAQSVGQSRTCNCRVKTTCPLNGQCLTENAIYQATISNGDVGEKFPYIGLAEGEFKTRYNNHTMSFRKESYAKKTELSKKYWEIKNSKGTPTISWKVLTSVRAYENGQKNCNLCLTEKLFIMKNRDKNLLNSRSEISAKCRHKRKFLLCKQ